MTKGSIPALEKMISERDSQIDFLTKNISAIELELRRLKAQSSSFQQDLALAKQDRDAETVARVELESIVQVSEDRARPSGIETRRLWQESNSPPGPYLQRFSLRMLAIYMSFIIITHMLMLSPSLRALER